MKMKKNFLKILKSSFCRCPHKLSHTQQKHLYLFAAMDLFMCYSKAVFYTVMTLFQYLHIKVAENQILRTANPSPELYPQQYSYSTHVGGYSKTLSPFYQKASTRIIFNIYPGYITSYFNVWLNCKGIANNFSSLNLDFCSLWCL